jgi:hypothetical protein
VAADEPGILVLRPVEVVAEVLDWKEGRHRADVDGRVPRGGTTEADVTNDPAVELGRRIAAQIVKLQRKPTARA